MIVRYLLHVEAHWGYLPRVSVHRAPRSGDRVVNGGDPGTLVRCKHCGEGFLHQPAAAQRLDRAAAEPVEPDRSVPGQVGVHSTWCCGPALRMNGGNNPEVSRDRLS